MAKQIEGRLIALSSRFPPSVSYLVGFRVGWGGFSVILSAYTAYEVGTECSETSAHDIQTPGNHPKERKLQNTAIV